jgi:hypothetical protein
MEAEEDFMLPAWYIRPINAWSLNFWPRYAKNRCPAASAGH